MLALSATTCEQVVVSPETAMGCHRTRFLQAEEGYYYTFSFLTNDNHKIQSLTFTYLASRLDKQTVPCLTLYLEFTAKLVFSSDLTCQLYIYQCIKEHNNNTTKTTTHDIMWFTPSLGATSTELCFIQLFTKATVLICALSYRSLQFLKLRT